MGGGLWDRGRLRLTLAGGSDEAGNVHPVEYCTSLDMAGVSLTLVKLDAQLNELLDAPADVAVRVF